MKVDYLNILLPLVLGASIPQLLFLRAPYAYLLQGWISRRRNILLFILLYSFTCAYCMAFWGGLVAAWWYNPDHPILIVAIALASAHIGELTQPIIRL